MFTRIALAVGTLTTVALLALGTVGPAPAVAQAAAAKSVLIQGTLQPGFATTAPTTLQVLTPGRGMVSVSVSSSTVIVRRYNGLSALDELSPGDYLFATGTMSGTTLNATHVKDISIQRAFTRNLGVITAINSSMTQLTVRVLRDTRFQSQNPFDEGEIIHINVTPAMSVTLADGALGTVQDNLAPGLRIVTLGVYNRVQRTFLSVARMRVLSEVPGMLTVLTGVLQPGFSANAPTTLTLLTPFHGTVTVSVASTTVLVRRYNGQSALWEFSAGDHLVVIAKFEGGTSYSATVVKDFSIQRGWTFVVGRITAVSGTTITLKVLMNQRFLSRRDPFREGQSIKIFASSATPVTLANGSASTVANAGLQLGMLIAADGLYDRTQQGFTSVMRMHIVSVK